MIGQNGNLPELASVQPVAQLRRAVFLGIVIEGQWQSAKSTKARKEQRPDG
tara:strand:- start:194 stop:346 length:153 start_codon:yes stop_codon:yes gene_type:complete